MEKSNKRGKIPQSDWPLIMSRYEAGETLASIARTYDCSPPAISYVVSKSRGRQLARDSSLAGPGGSEAQLIKGIASETAAMGSDRRMRREIPGGHGGAERNSRRITAGTTATAVDRTAAPAAQPPGDGRDDRMPGDMDGLPRGDLWERGARSPQAQIPAEAGHGRSLLPGTEAQGAARSSPRNEPDMRHRLHLSLGNGAAKHNASPELVFPTADRSVAVDSRLAPPHSARPPYPSPSRPQAAEFSEAGPETGYRLRATGTEAESNIIPRKEGTGSFIDRELRARVDTDIAAFLAAFDAALEQDTQDNRSALREATDRLLRAGARTRIELERLEARIPLTTRGRGADPDTRRYR
jgi:hypothetical protein